MNTTYEETFRVCAWDVDGAGRLTMAAVYNYCQEIAGNHAALLGVGEDFMKANGIVWILSRMSAVLESRPARGSRIRVRTWPRGTDRLFAIRDYELNNEAGTVVGRGRSAWLIVDAATFRPRRPEAFTAGLPTNEGLEALPDGALALAAGDGLERATDRSVAYSDIDYNGHMNNARYVQWIQDVMAPDTLNAPARLRLDINYLAEMKPGSAAGIFMKYVDGLDGWGSRYVLEGRAATSGQTTFRAALSLA
jgi:acyl-ACP thioesterase